MNQILVTKQIGQAPLCAWAITCRKAVRYLQDLNRGLWQHLYAVKSLIEISWVFSIRFGNASIASTRPGCASFVMMSEAKLKCSSANWVTAVQGVEPSRTCIIRIVRRNGRIWTVFHQESRLQIMWWHYFLDKIKIQHGDSLGRHVTWVIQKSASHVTLELIAQGM